MTWRRCNLYLFILDWWIDMKLNIIVSKQNIILVHTEEFNATQNNQPTNQPNNL